MLRTNGSGRSRGSSASPWRHVIAVWLAGVQAAVGLGAVSPVGSAVQSSLGLSFSTVACATSSMTAVGAVLGIPVGWWAGRVCARRALAGGLAVISAAAGLSTLAHSWALLLGLRTVEGAGYLLVFVAGPIVLTGLTRGSTQAAALALWGTCVPTGLAVAAAAGGALASELTWHRWLGVTGIGPLLLAGFLAATLPRLPTAAAARRPRRPAGAKTWAGFSAPSRATAWARFSAPAGAYACLSLIGVAVVVLLPSFLTGTRHATSAQAGSAAAVASAASAAGGLAAGWLLRHGVAIKVLAPLAPLMPLACLAAFCVDLPVPVAVGAAALVLAVDGLLISAVFAAVPAIARCPEEVSVANGALAQFGSLGVLAGPPVFGLAVGCAGWGGPVAATLLFTALGSGLLLVTANGAASSARPRQRPHQHPQAPLHPHPHPPEPGYGPAAPGQILHRRPE